MKTVQMNIRAEECTGCKSLMIQKAPWGVFPYYFANDQKKQAEHLGVKFISPKEFNSKKYCTECIENGKAEFTCFNCGDKMPTNMIIYSYGESPDFLCSDCFDNLTAREWKVKVDEIEENHKYDYYP